jgi:hypothetical protein
MELPERVLRICLDPGQNDAEAGTIYDYLIKLLYEVWMYHSPKKPFGNSGWEWDIVQPLIDAGLAVNFGEAERLIGEAITSLLLTKQ